MPLDMTKLRRVARGEIPNTAQTGVAGVTGVAPGVSWRSGTRSGELSTRSGGGGRFPATCGAGVADVAPLRQKSPELRQLRPLRVKNASWENETARGADRTREPGRDEAPTLRFCAHCSNEFATFAIRDPDAPGGERWLCEAHFEEWAGDRRRGFPTP